MMRTASLIVLGIVLVAAIGVGGAAVLGAFGDPGGGAAPADTRDAGDVDADRPEVLETSFEHFDGRIVRLSDWTGTPVVVNFWASWCPPCVAEMSAAFEPVHQDLGDRVAFVGLNLEDDPGRADEVVDLTGVTYELGRDPVGELFAGFRGFGMPTTIFLDETGSIVETHTGALSRAQLWQVIARAFGVEVP